MAAVRVINAWSARWGEWQIHLSNTPTGWNVVVWRWPLGTSLAERTLLDKADGHDTSEAAVEWACSVLEELGAQAFIDGRKRSIMPFLKFSPAPEVLP
jgi:hypothetical protein